MFIMTTLNEDRKTCSRVHVINVRGNLFLAPYHFVNNLKQETQVQMSHETIPSRNVNIIPQDIHRIDDSDWCIIHLRNLPQGRDILNHFASRDQLKSVMVFNAMLLSYGKDFKRITHAYVGDANRFDKSIEGQVNGKDVVHPTGYNYCHPTVPGMCGALLIATDATVRSKIMGMHFAYTESLCQAHASLISRERLLACCDKIVPPQQQFTIKPPTTIQCELSSKAPEFIIDGRPCFENIGIVLNAPSQARKHKDLFRSPAWNEVYPNSKDLSVLTHTDPRMNAEFRGLPTMLNRNVIGYSTPTCDWPVKELTIAKSYLSKVFNSFRETTKREVKSLEWAINGEWQGDARLEHAEALRLETSAGYGFPGKKQDYFDTSDHKNIVISDQRLQDSVDSLWEEWKNGNTTG